MDGRSQEPLKGGSPGPGWTERSAVPPVTAQGRGGSGRALGEPTFSGQEEEGRRAEEVEDRELLGQGPFLPLWPWPWA